MKRLKLKVKTLLIKLSCEIENWVYNRFVRHLPNDGSITQGLLFYWWIQIWTSRLFSWAYTGSAEEVQDGIDFAQDQTPETHLSPLQIEIKRRLCEWVDCEEAGFDL